MGFLLFTPKSPRAPTVGCSSLFFAQLPPYNSRNSSRSNLPCPLPPPAIHNRASTPPRRLEELRTLAWQRDPTTSGAKPWASSGTASPATAMSCIHDALEQLLNGRSTKFRQPCTGMQAHRLYPCGNPGHRGDAAATVAVAVVGHRRLRVLHPIGGVAADDRGGTGTAQWVATVTVVQPVCSSVSSSTMERRSLQE